MKPSREWPKTATFLGKRYRVRGVPNLGDHPTVEGAVVGGDTSAPHHRGRTIRIRQGMSPRETFRVAVHEALHALDWKLDEDAVDEMAGDITRFLAGLGLAPED